MPSKRKPAPPGADDTPASAEPLRNLDESPLAWLARRRDKHSRALLDEAEVTAGERLRLDYHMAQLAPRVTADWSLLQTGTGGRHRRGAPGQGVELQDHVVAARERVTRALKAVGPDLAGMLIDVCCYLKGLEVSERAGGWPQRSGKVVLQIALRHLARHYGILYEPASDADRRAARVRHWGSADYRPAIPPEARPDEPNDG